MSNTSDGSGDLSAPFIFSWKIVCSATTEAFIHIRFFLFLLDRLCKQNLIVDKETFDYIWNT